MIAPPAIDRELRIALRNRESVKSRFRVAWMTAGAVFLFLILQEMAPFLGGLLKQGLFFAALYFAIIPPMRLSVGLFCEERRNQTLELLYLAGMKPGELFAGKLLGGVLIASGDLLALFPFLAIPFLSGGLSLDLFWAMIACPPVLFIFTVAVGVLASVLTLDDGAALALAIVIGGMVCLAAPLPYWLGTVVAGTAPFSPKWLCLSPAYGPYLVARNFSGAKPAEFWSTAALTLVWAMALLCLGAFCLRRNWRAEISREISAGWRERLRLWISGSPAWRAALRNRLLASNPFQWLAEQDRRPLLLAWTLIAVVATFWLTGWTAWPRAWPSPVNLYLTAGIIIIGTGQIEVYAAAKQIGIARRNGSLELLLTTPLQPKEMLNGQAAANKAQFRAVRRTVLALSVVMMFGGFFTRSWTAPALVSYLVIWCFLGGMALYDSFHTISRAMWIALNTGRPIAALYRNNRNSWWWWPWMFINGQRMFNGLIHARNFPSGSAPELVIVLGIAVILPLAIAAQNYNADEAGDLLASDMRSVAQEPVPDSRDKRLKNWSGRDRLPPMASPLQELEACMKASNARNLPCE